MRARLFALLNDDFCTTIVTYEEQMRGWLSRVAQANTTERLVAAYSRLSTHLEVFTGIRVLPFDGRAAAEFDRLRLLRPRIGTQDTKIAAITLSKDATLLSRNLGDFTKIPGLRVDDWSA